MLHVILVLAIALPIAWLMSEFQDRRSRRIALGLSAIGMSFFVAIGVGMLDRFRSNSAYGDASKKLIDSTIAALETGHQEQVLTSLHSLSDHFKPSYEHRANYDVLVEKYADSISSPAQRDQPDKTTVPDE